MCTWIIDPNFFGNHRKLDGIASLSRVSAPSSPALLFIFFFFNLENRRRLVCISAIEKAGSLTKEIPAKAELGCD